MTDTQKKGKTFEYHKRNNRNALLNKERKSDFRLAGGKFSKNGYDMPFFFSPNVWFIFSDSQNREQRKRLRSEIFSRFDWRKRNVKIYCLE